MIKVLHYGLSENRGGIETYLNKLWTNIDKTKFHFDFIDTNLGKPCFYDEFREMGSRFFKITPRKKSLYKNKKDLEKLFKEEKFDILHCHLNTLSYIEPIKIALKYGCKVIVHSRNSNFPNSLITRILHFINYYRFNLKYKNKVQKLAVSKNAGVWLFGKKNYFQTINNGINIETYKFKNSLRVKKREELGISDKFIIGHVGALNFAKNHEFLFKVFKEYLCLNNNAILLLVGDGELKEYLVDLSHKMQIADKVKFLGIRSDIPELMFAMDVFVFPSRFEGFPNSVLEAQTTGLPCYISDIITPEIVVLDNCFRLSLNIYHQEWARRILKREIIEKREEAYKIVEKKGFSVAEEIKKLENIYIETFNNNGED